MDAMRVGVGIDDRLGLTDDQQRELVREAARLGYDSLWTPASVSGRSALHTCSRWWRDTTSVVPDGLHVGVSVVPFPAWSVVSLAAEAATVGAITGGKFSLGIGLGGYPSSRFRDPLGLPDLPLLPYTRDFVRALCGLLSGENVELDGVGVQLHGVKLGIATSQVKVYLGALGPQLSRVAGEVADGISPNWSSPEQIAWLRERVAEGARRAGRPPSDVPFAHYIRVCIDDDEDAAQRAFAENMLGYAMARPGQPKEQGYRGHFTRMGFDEVLTDLEARRDAGASLSDLADTVPSELLLRVGYFGTAAGAADALKRLSHGLDEAMVRLISTSAGSLEQCVKAVQACQPSGWRS